MHSCQDFTLLLSLSTGHRVLPALALIYIPQMQLNRFSYSKTESQLTIPDIKTVNSVPPCPLSSVCSPWDQSGWRCERGRCRCSRSRQREELHRLSRASRARPTHGAQMHVASAGAAAVAVPGRSRTTSQLAAWLTLVHSLSWCVSASRLQLVSHALDIFLHVLRQLLPLLQCKTYVNTSLLTAGNASS